MSNDNKNLAYIIAFAIVNDKQGLINFLSENAVIVKEKITDQELTTLVINSLNSSVKVQENFIAWISEKTNNGYANTTGFSAPTVSSTLGWNSTLIPTSGTSTTATTSTSSGFWSGFDAGAVTGILTSGLSLFGGLTQSKEQRKALEAQANAQIAAANAQSNSDLTQLEIAKLQLQATLAGKNGSSGSNTTLIVIGVIGGLAILGTVVYLVTRKK